MFNRMDAMTRDDWQELACDEPMLFADGFDDAVIGVTEGSPHRAVYSIDKMIEIMMEDEECDYDDALDYLCYNTFSAYVGEHTPIYVWTEEMDTPRLDADEGANRREDQEGEPGDTSESG